jgi:hypothetical protein
MRLARKPARAEGCIVVLSITARFDSVFKKKKFMGDSSMGETIYSLWLALEQMEPEGHTHGNGYSNNVDFFVSYISL